ncbi:hypothetical protein GGR54DRAFT_639414 [Hypoxylon sp. NC1633]|nr:hypothetical protein GGR54DRAFT_639414 [Hypoxylon sp. NC1633]
MELKGTQNEAAESKLSKPYTQQALHKPQWSVLIKILRARVNEARKAAAERGQEMSLEEHNAYYRGVFDNVREEVASRDDIPNAIMEKPTQTLNLSFYAGWSKPVCLSCLNFQRGDDIIHIEIHARKDEPDGVTKDDLVRCIGEVLYGGLHVLCRHSNTEAGVVLGDLDYIGTTNLCSPVENMIYVGYEPTNGQADRQGERYGVSWEPAALGLNSTSIQGYDIERTRKVFLGKGWQEEEEEMCMLF